MVKGLMAILYHYSSTEEDGPQKQYCSESETSWSKFQADKYNGRHNTHTDQLKTQEAVKEVFLPVLEKLGNQKFLEFFKSNLSSKPNKNLSSCPSGSCTLKFLLFNIRAAIGS